MKNLNVLGIIVVLILLTIRCNEDDRPVGVKNPPSITHVEKKSHDTELSVGDKDSLVFNVIVDEDVTATWSVVTNNQNVKFSATSGTLEKGSTLVKISFTAVDVGRDTVEFSVTDSKENSNSVTYILSINKETRPITITGLVDTINIVRFETFFTKGEILAPNGLTKVDLLVDGLLASHGFLELELEKNDKTIITSYSIDHGFNGGLQINFGLSTIGIHTMTYRATDSVGNVAKKDIIVIVSSALDRDSISITGLPDTIKIVRFETFFTKGEILAPNGLTKVDLLVDGLLALYGFLELELEKNDKTIITSYSIDHGFNFGLQINFGLSTIGIHTMTYRATDSVGNVAKKDIIVVVFPPLVDGTLSITGLPDTIKIVRFETFFVKGEVRAPYGLSDIDILVDGLWVSDLGEDFNELTKSYSIDHGFNGGLQINFGLSTVGIHTMTYRATDSEGNVTKKDIIVVVSPPLVDGTLSITGLPDTIKIVRFETFFVKGEVRTPYGLSDIDILVDGLWVSDLGEDFNELTKSYSIDHGFNGGLQINFGLSTVGIHTMTYRATDSEGNVTKKDIIVVVSPPLVDVTLSITGLPDTIKIARFETFFVKGEVRAPYGLSDIDILVDGLWVSDLGEDFNELTKSYSIDHGFNGGLQINFGLSTVGIHTMTYRATDSEGNVTKKDIIVVVSP